MNKLKCTVRRYGWMVLVFSLVSSCSKKDDLMDGEFPEVEIVSALYNPTLATLTLTGRIEDSGTSSIKDAGFVVGENGDYELEDQMAVGNINNDQFQVVLYYYLNENGERRSFSGGRSVDYYAFAANLETFGVSDLKDTGPLNENQVNVPCDDLDPDEIKFNTLTHTNFTTDNSFYDGDYTSSQFVVYAGSDTYTFRFSRFATPGIYYTTTMLPINSSNKVEIKRNGNVTIAADQQLFIRDAGNGKYEVILCTAYSVGFWDTMSARFLVDMH